MAERARPQVSTVCAVARVLVTGMSGAGKTTVLDELQQEELLRGQADHLVGRGPGQAAQQPGEGLRWARPSRTASFMTPDRCPWTLWMVLAETG